MISYSATFQMAGPGCALKKTGWPGRTELGRFKFLTQILDILSASASAAAGAAGGARRVSAELQLESQSEPMARGSSGI
jgi:hypothetical protein